MDRISTPGADAARRPRPLSLQGQSAVVLGGSSGMGLAVAELAIAEGAREVTVVGRGAEAVARAQERLGPAARGVALDAGDEEALRGLLEGVGQVDHLVFTAGAFRTGAFREQSPADAAFGMRVKFWGAWHAARHARIAPGGSILFFSGVASRRPAPGMAIVSAVNAAVEGLGRALAVELAPVRVNVISPGLVPASGGYAAMPEDAFKAMVEASAAKLPARRVGEPGDVAALAVALLANPYATGVVLDVDGGAAISPS